MNNAVKMSQIQACVVVFTIIGTVIIFLLKQLNLK